MMLRGMGFDNSTSIYLASGKIYWAEKHLAPLVKMFPYLHTKESLATPDELAPFKVHILLAFINCVPREYFGIGETITLKSTSPKVYLLWLYFYL